MEVYVLIGLILLSVYVVYTFWHSLEGDGHSDSELHARNRYAVAEKITKELNELKKK